MLNSSPLMPQVEAWLIQVTPQQPAQFNYAAWLSGDEQRRAAAFYFDRDRWLYVKAHLWLRSLLADKLAVDPAILRFAAVAGEKPHLVQTDNNQFPLYFNLSHTAGYIACAISRDCEVGIDVEGGRAIDDLVALADQVFHPSEQAHIQGLPPSQRQDFFLRIWSAKEAYTKAIGTGIVYPLQHLAMQFNLDDRCRFTVSDTDDAAPTACIYGKLLHPIDLQKNRHAFAIAVLSGRASLKIHYVVNGDDLEHAGPVEEQTLMLDSRIASDPEHPAVNHPCF